MSKLLQITKSQVQFLTTALCNSAIAWTTENLPSHTTNFGSVELAKGLFFFFLLRPWWSSRHNEVSHDSWLMKSWSNSWYSSNKKLLNIYIWLRTAVILSGSACHSGWALLTWDLITLAVATFPQGLLDAVCSSEDPVGGDESASADVPPAPTAVWLKRHLGRAHFYSLHRNTAHSLHLGESRPADSEGKREVLLFSLSWLRSSPARASCEVWHPVLPPPCSAQEGRQGRRSHWLATRFARTGENKERESRLFCYIFKSVIITASLYTIGIG